MLNYGLRLQSNERIGKMYGGGAAKKRKVTNNNGASEHREKNRYHLHCAHTINIDNVNTILSLNYWFGKTIGKHRGGTQMPDIIILEISKANVSCWLCFVLLDLASHIGSTKKKRWVVITCLELWWNIMCVCVCVFALLGNGQYQIYIYTVHVRMVNVMLCERDNHELPTSP